MDQPKVLKVGSILQLLASSSMNESGCLLQCYAPIPRMSWSLLKRSKCHQSMCCSYTDSGRWSKRPYWCNISQIYTRSRTNNVHKTWRKSLRRKWNRQDTPHVMRTSRLRLLLDRMINYLQSHPLECGTQDNWLPRQNVHLHLCRAGPSLDTTGLCLIFRAVMRTFKYRFRI